MAPVYAALIAGGIALGSFWLGGRRDASSWLKDQRLTAYGAFIRACEIEEETVPTLAQDRERRSALQLVVLLGPPEVAGHAHLASMATVSYVSWLQARDDQHRNFASEQRALADYGKARGEFLRAAQDLMQSTGQNPLRRLLRFGSRNLSTEA